MSADDAAVISTFAGTLFDRLRRVERLPLAPSDYDALNRGLRAGFGWDSTVALCNLCITLWAKSPSDRQAILRQFTQMPKLPELDDPDVRVPDNSGTQVPEHPSSRVPESSADISTAHSTVITPVDSRLPKTKVEMQPRPRSRKSLILPTIAIDQRLLTMQQLTPRYAIAGYETTQAGRRLRRPIRSGIALEADIRATLELRCRVGLPVPMVLRSRLRNVARLVLLVERQGSMTPFRPACDLLIESLIASGPPGWAVVRYFRTLPAQGSDHLLPIATDERRLDALLKKVPPLTDGRLYENANLTSALPFANVLQREINGASVVVVSEAGAAKGDFEPQRLTDTFGVLNALMIYASSVVWLNPFPIERWTGSIAAIVARHLPMFSMDADGVGKAMAVLRRGARK